MPSFDLRWVDLPAGGASSRGAIPGRTFLLQHQRSSNDYSRIEKVRDHAWVVIRHGLLARPTPAPSLSYNEVTIHIADRPYALPVPDPFTAATSWTALMAQTW
ncbi:MAG TPA: hypothetical protein VND96_06810 [Candidatus Micrarchaeaceae archaeon]|nr:hypothetical protein [Candidatus Micrarchaeaceae archaeon]